MAKLTAVLLTALFVSGTMGVSVHRALKDVQEFMEKEINKPQQAPIAESRSDDIVDEPRDAKILVGNTNKAQDVFLNDQSGKRPDKISVTIFKEYKVKGPDGGYVSIQEQGGDFKGSLNPPPIQEFIAQHAESLEKGQQGQDFTDTFSAFEVVPAVQPKIPFFPQEQRQEQEQYQVQQQPQQQIFKPSEPQVQEEVQNNLDPFFEKYKRKTMDGWTPIRGLSSFYKDTLRSKGTISPVKNVDYSLEGSGSSTQAQVVPFQQPQLQVFTQSEVIRPGGQAQGAIVPATFQQQILQTQTKNLVLNPQGQRFPVFPRLGTVPMKVEIHANNVILKHDPNQKPGTASPSSPNVSQIKAYESTPQVTASLREKFRLTKVPNPLAGQQFPPGGLPLRAVAQAIRNGAFSRENDVIPQTEEKEMQIMIPHTFKIRNPKAKGGYSTVSTQGLAALATLQDSVGDPSVNTPSKLSLPGGYNSPSGGYGGQIQATPQAPVHADYGDGVKYQDKSPIQIVDAQPASEQYGPPGQLQGGYDSPSGGYGGGGHEDRKQLLAELQQKLNRLIEGEMAKSPEYGPPGVEYGPPAGEYGPPAGEYGPPADQYGPPSGAYGPPGHGHEHGGHGHGGHEHGGHGHGGSTDISINFDTGDPLGKFHLSPPSHHHHEHDHHDHDHHHDPLLEIAEGPSHKEALVTLGKNLFYTALDFSRKYNPITFIEHVKEFPPVRFEVHQTPGHDKGHGGKGHHGKGHKRRNSKGNSKS